VYAHGDSRPFRAGQQGTLGDRSRALEAADLAVDGPPVGNGQRFGPLPLAA
jgi:hypothetical protein